HRRRVDAGGDDGEADTRIASDARDHFALQRLGLVERRLLLPDGTVAVEEEIEEAVVAEIEERFARGQAWRGIPLRGVDDRGVAIADQRVLRARQAELAPSGIDDAVRPPQRGGDGDVLR